MTITKPPKEQVRQYMQQRFTSRTPPKTPEQVRQELGWDMLRPNRK